MDHVPVLLEEVIDFFAPCSGKNFIDATFGSGGHARALLERGARVLAFDWDPAVKFSHPNLILINDNFVNLKKYGRQLAVLEKIHGVLLDLGLSSCQIEDQFRGFSFRFPQAPLDMRYSRQGITATQILNRSSKIELEKILREFGEEPKARKITELIIAKRQKKPLERVEDLLKIVGDVYHSRGRIHPATKTFQALRIAVNHELENLERFLPQAVEVLAEEGRLLVISFHSLEDRIVKKFFKTNQRLKILTKKPIRPSLAERRQNPRSRSAKLRAAEKCLNSSC